MIKIDREYSNTDDAVRNGNDAMLGFFAAESNQITNTSPTMVCIDAVVAVVSLGIMAIVLGRYFKKREKVTIAIVQKTEE